MKTLGTDGNAYLEIDAVTRQFGKVTALEKVSLSIDRSVIVSLVGQSGCGKSTLLRVIAGVERPDQGRIVLDGRVISGPSEFVEPEERNIGFIFQDYALFPHLSVTENVLYGLKRLNRQAAQARCSSIMERLGLNRLADRYPHMLSGGEQQRVALARALVTQPQILLMDEPFSNLDRSLRDGVRAETLSLLRELGTTVVMVTHDPEEALSSGDQIVLMRQGRVVQAGTGADLYDKPTSAYAAEFFGSFNKLPGACRNGFAETPLGKFAAPARADGNVATVYIRPHGLRLCRKEGIVDATVIDCTPMGEIEQTTIAVAALPEPLKVRSTERRYLRAGESVRLSVSPEQVFVF